ncbi:c-type cytochrome [Novosphingobium beihaiensis]|uniref:C-type cytochrome n=1 Tax=Novosphingobium beihaiensis TaxID=2930389 RepID=A0ABT0BTH0_9SPHN|nr:c-type cytochrome [Novosphingobium beihaiensis]MCJ2188327.1 c-type cytochrome [Novosphingobium beihaiensis]
MHFRKLAVALPLALLAACGGSGSDEDSTAAAPEAAAPANEAANEAPAPETPATPAETVTPQAAASTEVAAATAVPATKAPAAFAVCRACHSVEPGKNGVGPTLFGIVGSTAGEVPGYAFSPALKKSGIVWDREKLDTWLQGPMKMVPGTKMVITVPDAARRKALIDYLETLK